MESAQPISALNKEAEQCLDNDPRRMLDLSRQADAAAQREGDERNLGFARLMQGIAYSHLHRIAEAETALLQAQELVTKLNDRSLLARVNIALAGLYNISGESAKAIVCHHRSLDLGREIGNPSLQCNALMGLGLIEYDRGANNSALEYLLQALAIARNKHLDVKHASALQKIATVYITMGLLHKARSCLLEAEQIMIGADNKLHRASILHQLGKVFEYLGTQSTAIEYYQQALFIFRQIDYPDGFLTATYNLSLVLYADRQYERALDVLRSTADLCRDYGNRRIYAASRGVMGEIYIEQGEQELAYASIAESLDAGRKGGSVVMSFALRLEAAWHLNFGDETTAKKKLAEAFAYFERSGASHDKIFLQCEYARILAEQGRKSLALRAYSRALGWAEEGSYRNLKVNIHQQMHEIHDANDNSVAAAEHLQAAFKGQQELAAEERRLALERARLLEDVESMERRYMTTVVGTNKTEDQQLREALHSRFPALSATEEQVCSMIYFNMRSKEIADVLHSSHHTVYWHRYNIRKKLALPKGKTIRAFLIDLLTG